METEFSMSCPKCQSDDWKLASLVYAEGLTHVSTASQGGGIGVGTGGIGVGVGGGKTTGTHQTALSRLAAPPSGLSASIACLAGVLLFSLLAWLFSAAWLVLTAFCAFGVIAWWSSDIEANKAAMAEWSDRRMCQRCGALYGSPR